MVFESSVLTFVLRSSNLVWLPLIVRRADLMLVIAVHGRRRLVLCPIGPSCSRRCRNHLLDQLVGIQVSAHVRLRLQDGEWWGECWSLLFTRV